MQNFAVFSEYMNFTQVLLLCWFDYFLGSTAEICQIFMGFFDNSEINWPLKWNSICQKSTKITKMCQKRQVGNCYLCPIMCHGPCIWSYPPTFWRNTTMFFDSFYWQKGPNYYFIKLGQIKNMTKSIVYPIIVLNPGN